MAARLTSRGFDESLELALWTLKIASMVPVLLRFASIALLAASRPPTAVIMGKGHRLPSLGANLALKGRGFKRGQTSHILPQVHGLVRLSLGDRKSPQTISRDRTVGFA